MKRNILALSLLFFVGFGVAAAQDVYNRVLKNARHVLDGSTSSFAYKKVAGFQVDALNYIKGKITETDEIKVNETLDMQTYYMTEFLNLFYHKVLSSKDMSQKDKKNRIMDLIQISCANPLFNDSDKQTINKYIDSDSQFTPFCLDTNWRNAYNQGRKIMCK